MALIVTKCKVVSPALATEIKNKVKKKETGIVLKPKQEMASKSAAQIVHEQNVK
ncbi:hypothetical protein QJS10_CPB17g00756 [Acorus calamus]|uniref:Uncharacterized protein n=1 Tax=Acorus calamus TaxID=4465 RepID=A0AAV9CXL0_ACOCL|nr:hypothetical protein QJS10_CPB17g00756 [Acorus calamus]